VLRRSSPGPTSPNALWIPPIFILWRRCCTVLPHENGRETRRERGPSRGCGAAGSASHWQCEGQGFESPQLHNLIQHANRPLTCTNRFGGRSSFVVHCGQWCAELEQNWSRAQKTTKQGHDSAPGAGPIWVVSSRNLRDARRSWLGSCRVRARRRTLVRGAAGVYGNVLAAAPSRPAAQTAAELQRALRPRSTWLPATSPWASMGVTVDRRPEGPAGLRVSTSSTNIRHGWRTPSWLASLAML
jgi:hypothetical protein